MQNPLSENGAETVLKNMKLDPLFHYWVYLTGDYALIAAVLIYAFAVFLVGLWAGLWAGLEILEKNLRKAGVKLPGTGPKNGKVD